MLMKPACRRILSQLGSQFDSNIICKLITPSLPIQILLIDLFYFPDFCENLAFFMRKLAAANQANRAAHNSQEDIVYSQVCLEHSVLEMVY